MKTRTILLGALALTATLGSAFAAPAGVEWKNNLLVASNGMTLYTFDKDAENVSNCYHSCASNWPPLLASKGDKAEGVYGVVDRKDGTQQVTFNGSPLYFWINDSKAGDKTGDGVGGVWHIVSK